MRIRGIVDRYRQSITVGLFFPVLSSFVIHIHHCSSRDDGAALASGVALSSQLFETVHADKGPVNVTPHRLLIRD